MKIFLSPFLKGKDCISNLGDFRDVSQAKLDVVIVFGFCCNYCRFGSYRVSVIGKIRYFTNIIITIKTTTTKNNKNASLLLREDKKIPLYPPLQKGVKTNDMHLESATKKLSLPN